MLHLSEIKNPSPLIRQRADLMWARIVDETESSITYRVVPFSSSFNHRQKDKRLVRFDLVNETAECVSLETGSICEANSDFVPGQPDKPKMSHLCSHVLCAYQRLERLMESRARRAA